MREPMTVDQALSLAEEVTPAPAVAHEALKVLRDEVLGRWQQRTALSFRLQDLRAELLNHLKGDDTHPLYGAFHDLLATAEAWMHPGTLSEAAEAHLAHLKRQLADAQAAHSVHGEAVAWMNKDGSKVRTAKEKAMAELIYAALFPVPLYTHPSRGVVEEWPPIETAPKSVADGRRVEGIYLLGYCPDEDTVDPQACIDVIWWEPLLPNNAGTRGKWCRSACGTAVECKPTHWHHLPNASTLAAALTGEQEVE